MNEETIEKEVKPDEDKEVTNNSENSNENSQNNENNETEENVGVVIQMPKKREKKVEQKKPLFIKRTEPEVLTEMDKINQAEEFFERYDELVDAVKVNGENEEYLKTYIHDNEYVIKNFNMKNKVVKAIGMTGVVSISLVLILWLLLGTDLSVIAGIVGGFVLVGGIVFSICLNKYRLTASEKNQFEVNDGIREQMVILNERSKQLERQRDDYYQALGKKIPYISLDYMPNIKQIKEFMVNGSAETCEDAVAMFEQQLLMQQMTNIMSSKNIPIEKPKADDKERFGDPLDLIRKNKRKKRLEKLPWNKKKAKA